MSNIKIFVCHSVGHNSIVPDSSSYVHVHGGSELDKDHPQYMMRDDEGDNISLKNRSYCELTVQYWAWKNIDVDYYGFCHYRRYFSFNQPKEQIADNAGTVFIDFFDENVLSQINVPEDQVINIMNGASLAICPPVPVKNEGVDSVYEQYRKNHKIKDLDVLISVIHDISPEFDDAAREYLYGDVLYIGNMFIMTKDLFHRYADWMFRILIECEQRIDISLYNGLQSRLFGFLGERLFGIFYLYIKNKEGIKVKSFQRLIIINTEKEEEIEPAFKKNNIPALLISSNEYCAATGVFLKSILENASGLNNYDFIIMHSDISETNQSLLKYIVAHNKNSNNATVRFMYVNKNKVENVYKMVETRFNTLVIYRLLVPWILINYDKILVLDSDIIAKADIAELFNEDISDYMVGAVLDIVYQGVLNLNENDDYNYTKNEMGMDEPYNYVNAGVRLLNLKKIRKEYTGEYFNQYIRNHNFRIDEQDAFNALFEGKIKFIDQRWNFFVKTNWWVNNKIQNAPAKSQIVYESCREPFLIHWANWNKPWFEPDMDYAYEFWEVARRTPFYEMLINGMIIHHSIECKKPEQPMIMQMTMTPDEIMDKISLKKLVKRAFKNRIMRYANILFPIGTSRRKTIKIILKQFGIYKNR